MWTLNEILSTDQAFIKILPCMDSPVSVKTRFTAIAFPTHRTLTSFLSLPYFNLDWDFRKVTTLRSGGFIPCFFFYFNFPWKVFFCTPQFFYWGLLWFALCSTIPACRNKRENWLRPWGRSGTLDQGQTSQGCVEKILSVFLLSVKKYIALFMVC